MKIVAIGDSITHGDGLPEFYRERSRWTQVLAEMLGEEVVNKGVNGDTTRLGLERFGRDVQEERPDIVLIQFGFNDCNHWESDHGLPRVSVGAFRENLLEMMERTRTFNAHPILLPLFWTKRGPAFNSWLRPYAKAIDLIRGLGSMWDGEWHFETIDGLHLTYEDHLSYAKMVKAELDYQ